MGKNKFHGDMSDIIFDGLNYFILTSLLVIFLYPLVFVLSASFSSGGALIANKVWLFPVGFNIEGYRAVFNHRLIVTGFRNTFFYMFTGTTINLFMTVLAAYPLSRKDLDGRRVILLFFTFTMFFNAGLIPTYMLVRDMGMRNTVWSLLIPGAMSVWYVFVVRSFFESNIPDELLEASRLDGCNDFKFLSKVVLPLSKPVLAVMALLYGVGHWNSYFAALIYIDEAYLFPLQLVLRQVLIANVIDASMMMSIDIESHAAQINLRELLKYSLIVVSTVPFLILYPFVQKHFVKGIMIGSVKG